MCKGTREVDDYYATDTPCIANITAIDIFIYVRIVSIYNAVFEYEGRWTMLNYTIHA